MPQLSEHRLACTDTLKTLRYFALFQYPLNQEELWQFASCSYTREILDQSLILLLDQKQIFRIGPYYLPQDEPEWVEKRKQGEVLARRKMKKARRSAKVIAQFPFVRSVCISGSLSKGVAHPGSDIDFFIITSEDRLWITRTLLHLFKKLCFLVGAQHAFCMNYFLDESHPILEEKNRFTATELVTLIPVYGFDVYRSLMQRNDCWIQLHLPNQSPKAQPPFPEPRTSKAKYWMETLLAHCYPHHLNQFLMKTTDKKWRKKWKRRNYPMADYELAMKTKWYVSKQHPLNYQKKVLEGGQLAASSKI